MALLVMGTVQQACGRRGEAFSVLKDVAALLRLGDTGALPSRTRRRSSRMKAKRAHAATPTAPTTTPITIPADPEPPLTLNAWATWLLVSEGV